MKQKTFEIYKITDIANYVKNSLSDSRIIIIGERHHNKSTTGTDRMLQEKVMETIKNLKPKIFLYELLHAAIFDPKNDKLTFRNDDKERNDPVENSDEFKTWEEGFYYNLARKYKVKIIGCDLPSYIQRELDQDMCNQIREKKMGEIITDNSKSCEPLIVVLGNYHVKETSNIYNFIKSDYISICIDDVCDKCKENILDKDQDNDQCQKCKATRTRKIITSGFK